MKTMAPVAEDRGQKIEDRGQRRSPIRSVKDLEVYQLAYELAMQIFHLTNGINIIRSIKNQI